MISVWVYAIDRVQPKRSVFSHQHLYLIFLGCLYIFIYIYYSNNIGSKSVHQKILILIFFPFLWYFIVRWSEKKVFAFFRLVWYEYKLMRCSNKEWCKQCRYVKFKGTMAKWPVQKLTHRTTQKHVQHHDATDI